MRFRTGSRVSLAAGGIVLAFGLGVPLVAYGVASGKPSAAQSRSQEADQSTRTNIPSCINLHSNGFPVHPSSLERALTHEQFRSIVFWAKRNLGNDYNEKHVSFICRTDENTVFVRFEPRTHTEKSRAVVFNLDQLGAKDAGTELFIAPNITGKIVLDKSSNVYLATKSIALSRGWNYEILEIWDVKNSQPITLSYTRFYDATGECSDDPNNFASFVKWSSKPKYIDLNGDRVKDIVVDVKELNCKSRKVLSYTNHFIATEDGFQKIRISRQN